MTAPQADWPIDMAVFTQIAGSKASKMLPILIPVFLEDGDLLMGWMGEAFQNDDPIKLQHAAHRLKGNSASLGVTTIASLAEQLEHWGKMGDLVTAVQPYTALSQEYTKVKSALLDLISQVE